MGERNTESTQHASIEALVSEFENAWKAGQHPDINHFLPPDPELQTRALIELIFADLEYRLGAGEPVRVESYVQAYPQLQSQRDVLLDLITSEFRFRERREPGLDVNEYRERFPDFRDELGERLVPRAAGDCTTKEWGTPPILPTRKGATPIPEIPGYAELTPLGHGGMGVVYKARHVKLNRWVALKMIRGGDTVPEMLARFLAEARAVARLQHPNIVQVYETSEHDGKPYIALELVDGGSLDKKLRGKPMAPRTAAELLLPIAEGMHAAHQKGLVHRDLKPGNVLITTAGVPKVTDFGLAKYLDDDSDQTRTGAILGTPSYMAPEQAEGRGKDVGPATDVYALGAILYEALTGRPPFHAATSLETLEQVRSQEPVPPSRLQSKVPADLETICLKCLQKDARQRYAGAAAFADDLRRFLAGEPILARPVSEWVTLWRWCVRNPTLATTSAVAAGALGIAVTFIVVFATNLSKFRESPDAEGERARTEEARREASELRRKLAEAEQSKEELENLRRRLAQIQSQPTNTSADELKALRRRLEQLEQKPGNTTSEELSFLRSRLKEEESKLSPKVEPKTTPTTAPGEGWTSLFNGKDLTGWKMHPDAPGNWRVEGGYLVGRGPQLANLYTTRGDYVDFHFLVQARINQGGNSGQLFRKPFSPDSGDGYEAQIDSSGEGAKTGSLLIRGGSGNVVISKSLVPAGTWFTQEVIARGNRIIIKVNGESVVDHVDRDWTWRRGHLALQVMEPTTLVEFRRVEVKELPETKPPPGEEWVDLFNGKDLSAWSVDSGPGNAFQADKDTLRCIGQGAAKRGYLLSNRAYSDFLLRCQFRFPDDTGDSAVAFRALNGEHIGNYPTHVDVRLRAPGVTGNWETGSVFYGNTLFHPPSRKARVKSDHSWNHLLIHVSGSRVRIHINHEEVQDLDMAHLASGGKGLSELTRIDGRIGLQQATGEVQYRHIQIKTSVPKLPPKAVEVKPTPPERRESAVTRLVREQPTIRTQMTNEQRRLPRSELPTFQRLNSARAEAIKLRNTAQEQAALRDLIDFYVRTIGYNSAAARYARAELEDVGR